MGNALDEVRAWAQARSEARTTRDWAEADRLRAAIEAAGWRVIDRGNRFSLEPARAPDVVEAGRTRYGSSAAVPSILDQPATAFVTVVLVTGEGRVDLVQALAGLRRHAPARTQVVLVADRPGPEQEAELLATDGPAAGLVGGLEPEIVWTSEPLGWAGALNAGLRRAAAPVIVLLDPAVELTGDLLSELVGVLDDPTVALAGPWGLLTDDLRRFEPAAPGDVDAIDGSALAFRRAEISERGLLDEHFRLSTNLDIWWSLVLRDEGQDRPPRRAVAVGDKAASRPTPLPDAVPDGAAGRERLVRRSFYRVLDRFGARRDLLTGSRESLG
jgi:Glycosyl transferase family 2